MKHFDVVVVGGGHAGCEAALAASRMGMQTALITLDEKKIAEMSCNPSIGGVGKGQLTKEIDALGGEMARNADFTGIQFKRLNTRKGSAVQSSRCQSDKNEYARRMQSVVSKQERLVVIQAEVENFVVTNGRIEGVIIKVSTGECLEIYSKAVVVTSGTFMRAVMHCGTEQTEGGRFGENSAKGISFALKGIGFKLLRLKTGTPPRLLASSIDFNQMEIQPGDVPPRKFSFWPSKIELPQVPCFLTYTNQETHKIIQKNLGRSPLFSGQIKGIGPRYCPSIEDKVVKFPQKERHQLFFEPESLSTDWIYPNGISTSLPPDVQERFLKTIPGCESVLILRHGYAVEYDCVEPSQLKHSLESKLVEGLYFGGQVNGTSGYEEAAAQGLIAGINASLKLQNREPLVLGRSEAYIGVMIDDLVTLGISEPYRMFTSRAEFRLSLREDNATDRLASKGFEIGLLPGEYFKLFQMSKDRREKAKLYFQNTFVKPEVGVNELLKTLGSSNLASPQSLMQILRRPELGIQDLRKILPAENDLFLTPEEEENLEIEVKYNGYIQIQAQEIDKLGKLSSYEIPESLDLNRVAGLSFEVKSKISKAKPKTLSDASRVSGVTPAAIAALAFHLRQKVERTNKEI